MQNNSIPPLIMTSDPDSFANFTISTRKPQIIDQILDSKEFSLDIKRAFLDFQSELTSGHVQSLKENTVDRVIWDQDLSQWIGKKWTEIPWLLAESYFYRRILEITKYFQSGPLKEVDPFDNLKKQEMDDGIITLIDLFPKLDIKNSYEQFFQFCTKSLWGNRGDLSISAGLDQDMNTQHHRIIIDETRVAYHYLTQKQDNLIAYFVDNTGKELFFDFALIDFLLQTGLAKQITCFVKSQPFYVSDAMPKDFFKSIKMMDSSNSSPVKELSQRINNNINSGTITLKSPPFLTYGRTYDQLPKSFYDDLASYDLVILKGDLNYRRVMRDRHWHPTTPTAIAAGYFPTSFLIFRTLKAELIVGLTNEILSSIESENDPDWLTNGKRGLITFYHKTR